MLKTKQKTTTKQQSLEKESSGEVNKMAAILGAVSKSCQKGMWHFWLPSHCKGGKKSPQGITMKH